MTVLAVVNGVSIYKGGPNGSNPAASCMRLDSKTDYELAARRAVGWREDQGLTMAFARQLEHVFAKVFEAEFAHYRAHEFFPTSTEVGPGDLSFTYRMVSRVGQAAVVASNAKDLPNITVEGEEWPSPVITLGATYEFSVIEQASSEKAGIAIEAMKASATREAIEELEENIFALGFSAGGVPGVTNCLGVQAVTRPSIGAGTWQAQIAAATAASSTNLAPIVSAASAMQADLAAMKQRIYTQSLGRHKATNFLLPTNLYGMLDSIPQSPAFNGLRLLEFMEQSLNCEIDDWNIMLNAGNIAGSTLDVTGTGAAFNTRIVGYEKNLEVMQLIHPQMFIQLAPQPVGLAWQIPCYSRIGGAMSVRPLGICYMDGA